MRLQIRHRKLLTFAFLPPSVLAAAKANQNAVDEHFLSYLCFAFERARPENLIIKSECAIFAPGLKNIKGEELYCFFQPNRNNKQPWALTRIGSQGSIVSLWTRQDIPKPVDALPEFNMTLYQYAFVQKQKIELIASEFSGNAAAAFAHVSFVFSLANKYGYITYENDMALFHMGLYNLGEPVYALFNSNRNEQQPWFLIGFLRRSMIRGIQTFPEYVLEGEIRAKAKDLSEISRMRLQA